MVGHFDKRYFSSLVFEDDFIERNGERLSCLKVGRVALKCTLHLFSWPVFEK